MWSFICCFVWVSCWKCLCCPFRRFLHCHLFGNRPLEFYVTDWLVAKNCSFLWTRLLSSVRLIWSLFRSKYWHWPALPPHYRTMKVQGVANLYPEMKKSSLSATLIWLPRLLLSKWRQYVSLFDPILLLALQKLLLYRLGSPFPPLSRATQTTTLWWGSVSVMFLFYVLLQTISAVMKTRLLICFNTSWQVGVFCSVMFGFCLKISGCGMILSITWIMLALRVFSKRLVGQ